MKNLVKKIISVLAVTAILLTTSFNVFAYEIKDYKDSFRVEAEDFAVGEVLTELAGYSGAGYVGANYSTDLRLEVTLVADYSGWYNMDIYYAASQKVAPSSDNSITYKLNADEDFAFTGIAMDNTKWLKVTKFVELERGENTLELFGANVMFDCIVLKKATSIRYESETDAVIDTSSTYGITNSKGEIIAYRGKHTFNVYADSGKYELFARGIKATDTEDWIEITVNDGEPIPKGKYYQLNNSNPSDTTLQLFDLSGEKAFTLNNGLNTIVLESTGNKDYLYLDYIELRKVPEAGGKTKIYHAGSLVDGNNAYLNDHSGGGSVEYMIHAGGLSYLGSLRNEGVTAAAPEIRNLGDFLKFRFKIDTAGDYYMKVYYASENEGAPAVVYIDDNRTLTYTSDTRVNSEGYIGNAESSYNVPIQTDGTKLTSGVWHKSTGTFRDDKNYWTAPYFNMKVFRINGLTAENHTALFVTEYSRNSPPITESNNKGVAINRIEFVPIASEDNFDYIANDLTAYAVKTIPESKFTNYSKYIGDFTEALSYTTEGKIHVATQVYNTLARSVDASLMLATYKGNMLHNIVMSSATGIDPNDDKNLECSIEINNDISAVKAFLWKDGELKPIDNKSLTFENPNYVAPDVPSNGETSIQRLTNLNIGGGGYVTGIVTDSNNNVYLRTDNSGVYSKSENTWTALTDNAEFGNPTYFTVHGLATTENTIYAAVSDHDAVNEGVLIKSNDKGTTWTETSLRKVFQNTRGSGETVAIAETGEVFVACADGLYSNAGGEDVWAKKSDNVFSSLAISSGVMYGSKVDGIYVSEDSGSVWNKIDSSPLGVKRMCVNSGVLFTAGENGIHKYENSAFSEELTGTNNGFSGIDFSKTDSNKMVCVTGKDENGNGLYNNKVYYSENGGNTWTMLNATFIQHADYGNTGLSYASDIKFIGDNFYVSDWFGIYKSGAISGGNVTLTRDVSDLENTMVYTVISSVEGIYSGTADVGYYKWTDTANYPTSIARSDIYIHHITDISICEADPYYMAMGAYITNDAGVKENALLLSGDGGDTWTKVDEDATSDETPATCHTAIGCDVNADGLYPTVIYSEASGKGIWVTTDWGTTLTKCRDIPDGFGAGFQSFGKPLMQDRVDAQTFYAVYDGKVYVTTDNGINFLTYNFSSAGMGTILETSPKEKGVIWACVKGNGVYKSENYGQTFTQVGNFTNPTAIALGKGKTEGTEDVYIYDSGLYRSVTDNINFQKIAIDSNALSIITSLNGDFTKSGRLYISTNGRGAFIIDLD